ncbi:uncharacterized protein CTHT_0047320 [Thermochaetoides thermophila DSM 1495]|uniref:Reverse transcriptase domain-containing protein n=1 Tax=Chaetomium thermophilum (strain DSM 1495 / CBS 144.50 / IMI 039719) TaxID=759272 RepID=G0S9V5_CHATD|nr:hypothetical protein CTHT_0047320 [Thermochaetoides thermophila DSM 1495]EGS20216.1 hypothetical protein CTHT_0047320 [Thermochaetoides thermophila DSM 1495]
MVGNGRVISDTERMAAYLATQALACRGQEGSRPAWPGPRLPPEWAVRLADPPSDNELRDAFFGTTSNTPSPDGVPLTFLRHTWELVRPATRAIAEGCIKWGAFPKAFKQATVVTLSKPGRDPPSYKGWRPITLLRLSTFGKGVEMTAAALNSGLLPPDVAGAVSSRSALDLVQALVHAGINGRLVPYRLASV